MKKKVYKKPELYYESFTLSSSIAAGCEGIATFGEGMCGIYVPELNFTLFTLEMSCQVTTPANDDTFCYHAPTDSNNVFSS